jgi:paraquat-inducible protein B
MKKTGGSKDVIVVKRVDSSSLFSKQEIRDFVREFVASWIRGDIIIRFPTAAELAKKTPLSIAFPVDPSVDAELKIKEHYIDVLSVCAGTKQASAEEQEKAVTEAFKLLLMFRSANRIEGRIMSKDLDRRMAELERTMNSTGKLVDQITSFLFAKKKKPTLRKKRKQG